MRRPSIQRHATTILSILLSPFSSLSLLGATLDVESHPVVACSDSVVPSLLQSLKGVSGEIIILEEAGVHDHSPVCPSIIFDRSWCRVVCTAYCDQGLIAEVVVSGCPPFSNSCTAPEGVCLCQTPETLQTYVAGSPTFDEQLCVAVHQYAPGRGESLFKNDQSPRRFGKKDLQIDRNHARMRRVS